MARGNKILTIKNFKGLKTDANATLVDPDVMIDVNNLKVVDGSLQQLGHWVTIPTMPNITNFYDTQFLETTTSNLLVGDKFFEGDVAILSVSNGGNDIFYINPTDYTQTSRVYPIVQTAPYTYDVDGNTVTQTGCLITGWRFNSITRVGDRLEIQKGSVTNTFQYRIVEAEVAGAWSTDVPATTVGENLFVTINGVSTSIMVYFDDVSTFNSAGSGVLFSWALHKQFANTFNQLRPFAAKSFTYLDGQLFFFIGGRLFYCNGNGIASAGYRPIFGSSVVNFYNHLVVSQFGEIGSPSADFPGFGVRGVSEKELFVLAWSDLRRPHLFLPTQANEADKYFFDSTLEVKEEMAGITGLAVYNNSCYVTTARDTYVMTYVGLPLVMQVNKLPVAFSCGVLNCLKAIPQGLVAIDRRGYVNFFDGESPARRDDSIQLDLNTLVENATYPSLHKTIGNYAHLEYLVQTNELIISQAVIGPYNASTFEHKFSRLFYLYSFDNGTWTKFERSSVPDGTISDDPYDLTFFISSNFPDNSDGELNLAYSNILPVRYDLAGGYKQDTTFARFMTAGATRQDAFLVYSSDDFSLNTTNNSFVELAINFIRPLYDLAEISSVIVDVVTESVTGSPLTINLYGYDSKYASTPISTTTRSQPLTTSAASGKLQFHNINVKGTFFKLKVTITGTSTKTKINSITLTYRGDEQNVEK